MDDQDVAWHRRQAADLFNFVWSLLDKRDRSALDDDTMLHAAHASRYHWGVVGEPVNFARGEWQIARVYAVLGRAEPGLWHARRCLAWCQERAIGDFDLAYAHEAIARAATVAGDRSLAREHLAAARAASAGIAEDDDRQMLLADLSTIEVPR